MDITTTTNNNNNNNNMMEEDCFDPETSSVVDTNSWAILQLMQGGQAEAISHFHCALDKSRAQMRTLGPEQVRDTDDQTLDAVVCPVSLDGVIVNRGFNPSEMLSPHNYFRMYRTVFSIEGEDTDSEGLAPEITVVLLYNMAVVYQEIGFATAERATIEKARRLYELARSVLSQASQAKRNKLGMKLELTEMAILNNLGHIYCYSYNYELTMSLKESLRDILAGLNTDQLEHDSFVFFKQNMTELFHQRDQGTAPAA